MKKLTITLILCLWATSALAFPPGFIAGISRKGADAPAGDCDGIGIYSLSYNVDHTSGTTTACTSGGTTTVTLSGTGVSVQGTTDKYIQWTGAIDSFISAPLADTGITSQNGRFEVDVETLAILPANTIGIFEYGDQSTTAIITARFQYNATGYLGTSPGYRLIVAHVDGTSVAGITTYVAATINTIYHIIGDWNATTGKVYAKLQAGENLSSAGVLTSFTPTISPTDPKFGERFSSNVSPQTVGFDNILTGASQQ